MKTNRHAEQIVNRLMEHDRHLKQRIEASHRTQGQEASYAPSSPELKPYLPPGITQLYTHQQAVYDVSIHGEAVTIATPTASGKTYAMALPGRVRRGRSPRATMLCLAPTVALVEQWKEEMTKWSPDIIVESYTGDTPKSRRPTIRAKANIVITTPDMLHMGLLPYHTGWNRFLSNLQDVIIDESHLYRGVFGSHFSLIMRRFQRVISMYQDKQPSFLFGSATIGNPQEHAKLLLGKEVTAVTENGAPTSGRLTLLWQPPHGRGYASETAKLMAILISEGLRVITFGQNRQAIEKILREVRSYLLEIKPKNDLSKKVMSYRSGYRIDDRHEIERRFRNGEVLGLVSTSALEVGIDVGDVDVVLVAGFPGSISSYHQQVGRAGRRDRSALSILIMREDALDQYFAAHPEKLLDAPSERAMVNSGNPYILPGHLLCAAFEHPLTKKDIAQFGETAQEVIDALVEQGKLRRAGEEYLISYGRHSPAIDVNLRQVGERLELIVEKRKLEDTDIHHAITECYPGAIYFSQGDSYVVQQLDAQAGFIGLQKRETSYYTEPVIETEVEILRTQGRQIRKEFDLFCGDVVVTRDVTGYAMMSNVTKEALEYREIPQTLSTPLETKAFWMTIPDKLIHALSEHDFDPAGALHAVEHCMISMLPLFVLGDRRDMGGVSITPFHHQTHQASIFIYDGYPGGIGYSDEAFRQWDSLAKATLETLKRCDCEDGCFACIMSPQCGSHNRPLTRLGAIFLLEQLLETPSSEDSGEAK